LTDSLTPPQVFRYGKVTLCYGSDFKDVDLFPAFLDVLVSVIQFCLTLASVVIISCGAGVWCSIIEERFENCSDANDQVRT
jgi:hypothetical protein